MSTENFCFWFAILLFALFGLFAQNAYKYFHHQQNHALINNNKTKQANAASKAASEQILLVCHSK